MKQKFINNTTSPLWIASYCFVQGETTFEPSTEELKEIKRIMKDNKAIAEAVKKGFYTLEEAKEEKQSLDKEIEKVEKEKKFF